MSDVMDYKDDELYIEARSNLREALGNGLTNETVRAIDDLISVRLAIMMEEITNRAYVPALPKIDEDSDPGGWPPSVYPPSPPKSK